MRQPPHLSQLQPNNLGRDIIIGDAHGRNRGFKKILASLGQHDRLFCSGDIFDRGQDSIGVFQTLKEYIEKGMQIFVRIAGGLRRINQYI